jgi:hypothetical protein
MSVIVAIVSHLGIVAISGTLFMAFNSYNRQLALIGSVFRLGESLVMIFGEVTVLKMIDLAREYVRARAFGNLIFDGLWFGIFRR